MQFDLIREDNKKALLMQMESFFRGVPWRA
jgi:hypothetical protein